MNEIECPYCEHQYDLCHDDGAFYDEDNRTEEECPECGKRFMVTSSISWDFNADKADCLNGGEHNWEKKYPVKHFPQLTNKEICRMCDQERNV